MLRPSFRTPKSLCGTLAVAVAVSLVGNLPEATAQYGYAPHPDYYRNDTLGGTVTGGAFGAITGAILGGRKDRGEGALIGAGVGALAGNLLGRSKDQADARMAAAGASSVAYANQQAAAQAVTNYDLVQMVQAGMGEEIIVSTLRARGARLDLSPQGLIALKQSGVSDRVLIAAQDLHRVPAVAAAPPVAYVAEPVPAPVYVTPYPYAYGPRVYHSYYGPHCGPRPRAGVHYHFGF